MSSKQFTIVKRGYFTEEVDEYIKNLERTIEDYKEKDSSIKNAIVNAQVAADNIIKNSEIASIEIRDKSLRHLDYIAESIHKQREVVKEFQENYEELINKYLKNIKTTDFLEIFAHINELENYINTLKKENDELKKDLDQLN